MAQLALTLLGPLQATLDGVPVAGFESQKVRALLAYLALEAKRPHAREVLAGLLWPNQTDQDARNNLRQALANLRQALGDQRATPSYLLITRDTVQFNRASTHQIDVVVFMELLATCDQHPHRHPETCRSCAQRLQQAVKRYHGDFLSAFFLADSAAFEEWALLKREWLHQRALAASAQLASYYERRGEYAHAQQQAQRQLELDPWREESHRQLMRVLAAGGERSAALVQYATCRRILAAELGVAPEVATTALYDSIQRGSEVAPPHAVQLANILAAHTPPTPLLGRATELAQLAEHLEDRNCRLLTLVGMGGIGKTRLALQAASDLDASFPDGVCFVPLVALTSAELLVPAIASALGLALHGLADPKTQLLAYLRAKDVLLVLDNFEQLLDGADVLSDIVQDAPGIVLLATSREPLNLRMEWLLDTPGLSVPERADAIGVEQSSAVQLFVQTARRMRANFALSPEIVPSVAHICQLVAGMPLAIELAASWVRSRSCSEIARGLEQSLEQLATTMQDVPTRHRSMRVVFDQSWRLLSAAEQCVLRRLAVFRGGMQSEGRDWLTRFLALAQSSTAPPSVRAEALHGAGVLARQQSDSTRTAALCGESVVLFRDLDDKRGMAWSLNELGWAVQAKGDVGQAAVLYQQSLTLFRGLGDQRGIAEALDHLGRVARIQSDYRQATTLFQESLFLILRAALSMVWPAWLPVGIGGICAGGWAAVTVVANHACAANATDPIGEALGLGQDSCQRDVWVPLYRLRSVLSQVWQAYLPSLSPRLILE
jgi:DNA-binding SARP family transcriptional activator